MSWKKSRNPRRQKELTALSFGRLHKTSVIPSPMEEGGCDSSLKPPTLAPWFPYIYGYRCFFAHSLWFMLVSFHPSTPNRSADRIQPLWKLCYPIVVLWRTGGWTEIHVKQLCSSCRPSDHVQRLESNVERDGVDSVGGGMNHLTD